MRAKALLAILAASVLGGCVSYGYNDFELTVVDAETFEPIPGAEVVIDYGFGEVLNPPPQVRGRTAANGRVNVSIAEWSDAMVQVGGTRYWTTNCGSYPRGWLHPDGAEYLNANPDFNPDYLFQFYPAPEAFRNNVGRMVPAGQPGMPTAAVFLRPLSVPEAEWQQPAGRCSITPFFPAP